MTAAAPTVAALPEVMAPAPGDPPAPGRRDGQATLARVLVAAALLWCRSGTWPTVRAIAAEAGVAPSTVLRHTRTSAAVRRLLVEGENAAFARAAEEAQRTGLPLRAAQRRAAHARTTWWRTIHPELAWLPLLAALAGDADGGQLAAITGGL